MDVYVYCIRCSLGSRQLLRYMSEKLYSNNTRESSYKIKVLNHQSSKSTVSGMVGPNLKGYGPPNDKNPLSRDIFERPTITLPNLPVTYRSSPLLLFRLIDEWLLNDLIDILYSSLCSMKPTAAKYLLLLYGYHKRE